MYLYHIHREMDKGNFTKGYIGVSIEPKRRWTEHKNRSGNIKLARNLNKYNDIVMTLITEGSEEEMLRMETWLRPEPQMGWNIAAGGGNPPKKVRKDKNWITSQCKVCKKVIEHTVNIPRDYCSKECMNNRTISDETKRKQSIAASNRPKSVCSDSRKKAISLAGRYIFLTPYCNSSNRNEVIKACGIKSTSALYARCVRKSNTLKGYHKILRKDVIVWGY